MFVCFFKIHIETFFLVGVGAMTEQAHLWFVWLPRVGCVQFSEDPQALGLQGLLPVDVVHLGLPAPEDQDHGAGTHSWGPEDLMSPTALMPDLEDGC